MSTVGIEESLSDIRAALENKGYDLKTLKNQDDATNCDCCVITGQDRNVMGIMDTASDGSVIDAHGRTVEEVTQAVDSRLS